MASIDKIYGTYDQWVEFHYWVANSDRPQYCRYFLPTPEYGTEGAITNFSSEADEWLWDNCPLPFVQRALREQYNNNKPGSK